MLCYTIRVVFVFFPIVVGGWQGQFRFYCHFFFTTIKNLETPLADEMWGDINYFDFFTSYEKKSMPGCKSI